MSREGDYSMCSKSQPVVCHEKVTTASVVRGGQWYVARRRLLKLHLYDFNIARRRLLLKLQLYV